MSLRACPADAEGPPTVMADAPHDTMPDHKTRASDRSDAAATFETARCARPVWPDAYPTASA